MEHINLTLTVREILDLARATGAIFKEFPNEHDDLEIEYTIIEKAEGVTILDDDKTPRTYRHGAYLEEYPEEGIYGLGEEIKE